jgi:hypothetical protein
MLLHAVGHRTQLLHQQIQVALTISLLKASCAPRAHVNKTLCAIRKCLPACAALDNEIQLESFLVSLVRAFPTLPLSSRQFSLQSSTVRSITEFKLRSRSQQPASARGIPVTSQVETRNLGATTALSRSNKFALIPAACISCPRLLQDPSGLRLWFKFDRSTEQINKQFRDDCCGLKG